jgi:hypothetical protein
MSAKRAETEVPEKVTREDIEAKLRELQGGVDRRVGSAKASATVIAVGVAVTAVVIAYWMGRRRTRKRQTVFEIRRI